MRCMRRSWAAAAAGSEAAAAWVAARTAEAAEAVARAARAAEAAEAVAKAARAVAVRVPERTSSRPGSAGTRCMCHPACIPCWLHTPPSRWMPANCNRRSGSTAAAPVPRAGEAERAACLGWTAAPADGVAAAERTSNQNTGCPNRTQTHSRHMRTPFRLSTLRHSSSRLHSMPAELAAVAEMGPAAAAAAAAAGATAAAATEAG
jgi:hypothetical protein